MRLFINLIAMALALLGPGLAGAQPDQGLSESAFKEQLRSDLGADFVTPAIEAMNVARSKVFEFCPTASGSYVVGFNVYGLGNARSEGNFLQFEADATLALRPSALSSSDRADGLSYSARVLVYSPKKRIFANGDGLSGKTGWSPWEPAKGPVYEMRLERRNGSFAAYVTYVDLPVPVSDREIYRSDAACHFPGAEVKRSPEGPGERSELVPASCQGSIFQGAGAAAVSCDRVIVLRNPDQNGQSAVAFVVRDPSGTEYLLDAIIESAGVLAAARDATPRTFNIAAFYVRETAQPERNKTARWPLQGSCTVSRSQIECRTNDAVGGFAISASF